MGVVPSDHRLTRPWFSSLSFREGTPCCEPRACCWWASWPPDFSAAAASFRTYPATTRVVTTTTCDPRYPCANTGTSGRLLRVLRRLPLLHDAPRHARHVPAAAAEHRHHLPAVDLRCRRRITCRHYGIFSAARCATVAAAAELPHGHSITQYPAARARVQRWLRLRRRRRTTVVTNRPPPPEHRLGLRAAASSEHRFATPPPRQHRR